MKFPPVDEQLAYIKKGAAEIIREQLLLNTSEEIPYATTVIVDSFEEGARLTRIAATIYCERDGQNGARHGGLLDRDEVIDLQAADPSIPTDLGELLRRSEGDLSLLPAAASGAPSRARYSVAQVKFGLPVANPGKIICLGLNYLEHVREGPQRDNIPKFPTIFLRSHTSLVPHGQPILRPRVSAR